MSRGLILHFETTAFDEYISSFSAADPDNGLDLMLNENVIQQLDLVNIEMIVVGLDRYRGADSRTCVVIREIVVLDEELMTRNQ